MAQRKLTIRKPNESDLKLIIKYWTEADDNYLNSMGVDVAKMPDTWQFQVALMHQLVAPVEKKNAYILLWELDGAPIGHSNTNPTFYGNYAHMHLHIWYPEYRGQGLGLDFLRLTIPQFFEKLKLQKLICEPYALNPAPNKTLENLGFEFVKDYVTVPGSINFEQPVKRWEMTRERGLELEAEE